MSSPQAGYVTVCKLQVGVVSVLTVMGQCKSADITANANIYDVTAFGTNWKAIIPGINDYSLKFMANMDLTDAVQLALFNAYIAGSLITWSISPKGDSHALSGTGYLKSIPIKFAVNAVEDIEFDLDGTGALAYA